MQLQCLSVGVCRRNLKRIEEAGRNEKLRILDAAVLARREQPASQEYELPVKPHHKSGREWAACARLAVFSDPL